MEPPTGTNGGPFVRVGGSTRDKKPLSPTLARLAVGPGAKATFYPGPKGNRDKWPGTKTYFIVVVLGPLLGIEVSFLSFSYFLLVYMHMRHARNLVWIPQLGLLVLHESIVFFFVRTC